MTMWMAAGGDVSVITSEIAASLPVGLQPDPGDGEVVLDGTAPLRVVSEPDGARVMIDGHERGRTPVVVRVASGTHTILLKHPDALDEARVVDVPDDGTSVSLELWRRRPSVAPLRPPYPGSTIADATFLGDGRIALTIALPERETNGVIGTWHEVWLLDPSTGAVSRFDTAGFSAPRSQVLSISPDGRSVAYLQQSPSRTGPGFQGRRLNEVWVAAADGGELARVFVLVPGAAPGLYATTDVEQLIDVAWTPGGDRLLVVTQIGDSLNGPVRSRLLVVEATPSGSGSVLPPIGVVTMPATVIPGSYSWAPDGHWVAFLARAAVAPGGKNVVTLNAVDLEPSSGTGFRYLADLGRTGGSAGSASLPIAPVAWEPRGPSVSMRRLVYSAPTPTVGNGAGAGPFGLLGGTAPEPKAGLFVATSDDPALARGPERRVGSVTGLFAPVWRATEPESVMTLARSDGSDKALSLRSVDLATGRVQDLGVQLPATLAPGSRAVGARWDEARGQAIVVAPKASGGVVSTVAGPADSFDFWLVRFTANSQTGSAGSH